MRARLTLSSVVAGGLNHERIVRLLRAAQR